MQGEISHTDFAHLISISIDSWREYSFSYSRSFHVLINLMLWTYDAADIFTASTIACLVAV